MIIFLQESEKYDALTQTRSVIFTLQKKGLQPGNRKV